MTERQVEVRSDARSVDMTQVMRGVAPAAAPKSLRIAIVHRGVVVEERVMARGAPVTVGPTERATFVVASSGLSPQHELFGFKNGAYRLHWLEGMGGRVATRAGVLDIATFEADSSAKARGDRDRSLVLADDARGRIVIGDATLLFQFVQAKPPRSNVPLPIAARSTLVSEIDWTTAIVAAFSFLLHFGVVASIYGDWLDPLVDDSVVVGQLLETVRALPTPPAVERLDPQKVDAVATSAATTVPVAAARSSVGSGQGARSSATGGKGSSKTSDARAAELGSALRAANLEMIGVLTRQGSGADEVLRDGVLPLALLEGAARSEVGAGRGTTAGLDLRGDGSSVVRPGGGDGRDLTSIGNTQGTAPITAGSAVAAPRPKGQTFVDGPVSTGPVVPNAGAVVAGMARGFRRCYNLGLTREDPTMHGSMRVTARIGPNGDVVSASPSGGGTLSGTVTACVAAQVASSHFDAPTGGGGATLVIPVTFVPQ